MLMQLGSLKHSLPSLCAGTSMKLRLSRWYSLGSWNGLIDNLSKDRLNLQPLPFFYIENGLYTEDKYHMMKTEAGKSPFPSQVLRINFFLLQHHSPPSAMLFGLRQGLPVQRQRQSATSPPASSTSFLFLQKMIPDLLSPF